MKVKMKIVKAFGHHKVGEVVELDTENPHDANAVRAWQDAGWAKRIGGEPKPKQTKAPPRDKSRATKKRSTKKGPAKRREAANSA